MKNISKQAKFNRKIILVSGLLLAVFLFYWLLSRRGYLIPLRYLPDLACLSNCEAETSARLHAKLPASSDLNYNQAISQLIAAPIDKSKISILIEKSKYRLTVYYNLQPIKSYPVAFGSNPTGDKRKEGDNKTPEGIFKIKDLYPHAAWSKFLWIDYPNRDSWRKHARAKFKGEISWLDTIGGEVGIHGVPAGEDGLIDSKSNWTWGCISLKNRDVDELYSAVTKGTAVEILP